MILEQTRRQFEADKSEINSVNLIVQSMRAGLVPEKYVRACSLLGDKLCNIISPSSAEITIDEILPVFSKKFSVGLAVWCAKKSLHIFEERYPDDGRPRLAIEATENWLKDPSEENREITAAVRHDAWEASYVAYKDGADAAAWAAESAAFAASGATRSIVWSIQDAISAVDETTDVLDVTDKELVIEYLMKDIL